MQYFPGGASLQQPSNMPSSSDAGRGGSGAPDGGTLLQTQTALAERLETEAVIPLNRGKRQISEKIQKRKHQTETNRIDYQKQHRAQRAGQMHPLAAARLHDKLIEILNGHVVKMLLGKPVF